MILVIIYTTLIKDIQRWQYAFDSVFLLIGGE